jgi:Ku protein
MPRAIWSGAIVFGLVNVPVRMYSAIDEQDIHFHLVHEKDGSRIGYEKVCKKEGKPVPDDEIVKAYESGKGKHVYMTDEDFEAAAVEGYKTIDISDFVPRDEIDPIYFERTYYLGPQEGAEKVYALLRRAMDEAGLAGIAKYVMRERQHLGALRVYDGVIALEKMFFADEIRPSDDIAPGNVRVDKSELDMALQLIDRFSGTFKPEKYDDTYREQLLAIIDAKRKGKEVHLEPAPKAEEPADLMDALRASLDAAKTRRTATKSRTRSSARKPASRKRTAKSRPRKATKKAA